MPPGKRLAKDTAAPSILATKPQGRSGKNLPLRPAQSRSKRVQTRVDFEIDDGAWPTSPPAIELGVHTKVSL
jgi:hypothetical protein